MADRKTPRNVARVVAQNGKTYLITNGEAGIPEMGQILDLPRGILYEPVRVQSVLKHGHWDPPAEPVPSVESLLASVQGELQDGNRHEGNTETVHVEHVNDEFAIVRTDG